MLFGGAGAGLGREGEGGGEGEGRSSSSSFSFRGFRSDASGSGWSPDMLCFFVQSSLPLQILCTYISKYQRNCAVSSYDKLKARELFHVLEEEAKFPR